LGIAIYLTAGTVGLLLFIGLVFSSVDLGKEPTKKAFERIFRIPPPSGVHDLKVAGIAHMSGEAGMTFRVADVNSFLKAMLENPATPIDKEPNLGHQPFFPEYPSSKYRDAIGWDQIGRLKHREEYGFGTSNSGWAGVAVADRERKMVFVQALLY
jgi:hypothetical protein